MFLETQLSDGVHTETVQFFLYRSERVLLASHPFIQYDLIGDPCGTATGMPPRKRLKVHARRLQKSEMQSSCLNPGPTFDPFSCFNGGSSYHLVSPCTSSRSHSQTSAQTLSNFMTCEVTTAEWQRLSLVVQLLEATSFRLACAERSCV